MANKKTKVNFILTCDYVSMEERGKVSIIGTFDIIGSHKFPVNHPEMFIIAQVEGESGSEHELKISIRDPQGKDILSKNAPKPKIKLGNNGKGNLVQRFFNFPLNMPGGHSIHIFEGNEEIGKSTLSVVKVTDNTGRVIS